MISEERLKEIISSDGIIYGISQKREVYIKNFKKRMNKKIPIQKEKLEMYENYYYETKEEAEWIAQNWCEKKIVFQPPVFEEFMKYVEFGITPFHLPESIEIDINEDWKMFYVVTAYTPAKNFEYIEDEDKKQAYYQAVEYAKKLFLGDGENE